ncbi:scarecrow-like protein 21 [Magnolia sinica]|uniref:scarecrow-like protein 21 n=1 Tax=Magnolia sinica TaxID=86752 RepID=UPI00265835D6|nr:scarecrow-like protein 21 [Magnolia sinica]
MQASNNRNRSDGSQGLYYQVLQEVESYSSQHNFQPLDCLDEESKHENFPIQASHGPTYSTLESSSAAAITTYAIDNFNNSFSTNESPLSQWDPHHSPDHTYESPIYGSSMTYDANELKQKLQELEIAMLGPDSDIIHETCDDFDASSDLERWKLVVEIPKGDLKSALIACARAIEDGDLLMVEWLVTELKQMVSVSGDPIQRLGAYMMEGLIAKLASSGSSIYKSLHCKEPAGADFLSYMHILYEICPYFKFGYMSANGAIVEAVKGEDRVHIIDFQIAQGSQWITLLQALSARPGGPPYVRITGVDDSISEYARGGGLKLVGRRLSMLAESLNVPFEFHAAARSGCEVESEHLVIRPGEALAVNFAFQLHHMPDESVSTSNHRDRILRLVKSLSPKVVTLVEQECNTNTASFVVRFIETFDHYKAVFESLDFALPRDSKERIGVEQHCLARDVVNVIACEGVERIERHEVFGKWKARFMMAGFRQCPLSSVVNATIKTLLESYCENYRLEERDGVLFLGWMDRALVVSCAWR